MSATITTPPRYLSLSQDNNFLTLATDLVASDFPLVRLNAGDTAAPADGNTFVLEWENLELTFTWATTPDVSGTQLPLRGGGETAEAYRNRLVLAFRESELLARYWRVINSNNNNVIRFQYKVSQPLTVTGTSTAAGMAFVVEGAGSFPTAEENLRAVVQVFDGVDDDTPVVVLEGDYQTSSPYATIFNLANVAPVSVFIPPVSSMAATVPDVNEYSVLVATEAFRNMYFRYADKYGNPPVAEALRKSDPFHIIFGGSPGSSRRIFGSSTGRWLCHAYYDAAGTMFARPITDNQPDYVFLWSGATPITISVHAKIQYSDGSTDTLRVPGTTTFVLATNTLYCFPAGPLQMGISYADNYATKTAVGYEFQIRFNLSTVVLFRVQYQLEYCPEWEILLAYSNGLGGIETIPFTGLSTYGYEVERQIFERVQTSIITAADGTNLAYDKQGLQTWQATTTNIPRPYAVHLHQLLLGETWMIDRKNQRWLRVQVTDTNISQKDDEDLYSITITFKMAMKDNQYHQL